MRTAVVAVVLLVACKTGSPDTFAGAATMTMIAAGVGAAQRAEGGCIAVCTAGTVCNPNTGFCERPKDGAICPAGQHPTETFSKTECVSDAPASVASKPKPPPAVPLAPVLQAPDPNHSSPTIVPAAEQQQAPAR
jgi:hypothetical protein